MDSLTNSERVLYGSLYCLMFVTGVVDAGSYLAMGHVFTANMTGNIVFLGFAFGGVPGMSIGRSVSVLGFGLTGGVLAGKLDSSLTTGSNPRWRRRVRSVLLMLSGAFIEVQLLKHSLALLPGVSAVLTAFCTLAQIYRHETQHEAGLREQRQ
jgi:uncharacterized membrane protein YoaK (UPF0700 family)